MKYPAARNNALVPGFVLVLLALFAASLVLVPQQARAFEPEAKVAYHADFADPRRFSAMLTSINNMVTHYEREFIEADVRIVFVSHGIRFLTEDNLEDTPFEADEELLEERERLQSRLRSLANTYDVQLELCDITRGDIGLPEEDLMDGVDIELVPSGVVRLTELQNDEDFAYLKIE
ncbi:MULTISPECIES: DsrE family protein [unclassified Thioalkalivibrio]|uniref:DsrE family protein n=1 Tax=unclassified Thioalkalivibrio TaxID=2621013 RepID=UPI00036305E5|nr:MULTISPECIES: DsrE family protein [unclassified Thioalkalivibrio]